ncbi:lipoprotein [Klebsiella grimontii]|nr:lipoprotein [Klebsiella grimontii]
MRLPSLLPLLLLSLPAFASGTCSLTDPSLTLQSYTVDPQRERIVMYWQNEDGKAWGSLRSLLGDINRDGQVQMAMNGGIYDKAYAPLGLVYRERSAVDPA